MFHVENSHGTSCGIVSFDGKITSRTYIIIKFEESLDFVKDPNGFNAFCMSF